ARRHGSWGSRRKRYTNSYAAARPIPTQVKTVSTPGEGGSGAKSTGLPRCLTLWGWGTGRGVVPARAPVVRRDNRGSRRECVGAKLLRGPGSSWENSILLSVVADGKHTDLPRNRGPLE